MGGDPVTQVIQGERQFDMVFALAGKVPQQ